MTTAPAATVNLHGAALALVTTARRRQVAPSAEARAQHLGELEAQARLLEAMNITGGLDSADVLRLVHYCIPAGRVPAIGGVGLGRYLDTWTNAVAYMLTPSADFPTDWASTDTTRSGL